MLVTGDREAAEGAVSVRSRSAGDLGTRALDVFIADAIEEIRRKDQAGPAPAAAQQSA
jgi:threonyl-tRNA synthetase